MDRYLHLFGVDSARTEYEGSQDYIEPYVSLVESDNNLYYNKSGRPIVYEGIDLGLPSGTLWSNKNIGAFEETDCGLYFAWGDTQGYEDGTHSFTENNYKWYDPNASGISAYTKYANAGSILENGDDAAQVVMGNGWHMPTQEQCLELINSNNTTYQFHENYNNTNVSGATFTSKVNGNSIFIPFNGKYGGFGEPATYVIGNKSVTATDEQYYAFAQSIRMRITKAEFFNTYRYGSYKYYGYNIRAVK